MQIASHRNTPCPACATVHALEWDCVPCLVAWLARMNRIEQIQHARIILDKSGKDVLDAVRTALQQQRKANA